LTSSARCFSDISCQYSRAVHPFGGDSSGTGIGRIRICQSRQRKGDSYNPCSKCLELETFRFGEIKSVRIGFISGGRVERGDMNVTPSNNKVVGYRDKYSDVDFSWQRGSPSKIPMKEAIKTVYEPKKVMNCGRQHVDRLRYQ